MGVPVVIAENGLGMPVRAVESGAPVLQVAENGFGIPIVLSDLGAPFIVLGAATSATVPPVPSAPTVSDVSADSATVSWGALATGGSPITQVDLQWRDDAFNTTNVSPATSPVEITSLDPNSFYQARIRARNSVGIGDWSGWANWTTSEVIGGPVRTPTANTGNVVYGGNSSLFAAMDAHSAAWSSGSFSIDPGQSSEEVWDADGDARNGTYAYLHLSEIDDYTGSGYADPDSAQGIVNLQHLYWLGLEAVDRGANLFLFTSPSHRTIDNDAHNREVMNYYRWWLQDKLSVPVWVTDAPRIVRNLEATYGAGDSAIYADDLHYTAMTGRAFGWALYAQVTGDTPAGAEATDAVAYAAVWDMLNNYWWAGFGGAEGGDMWVGADPLPSPDPRPTPAAYRVLWTADGYDGPTLTGDQPTITGDVMAFDGSGLRNDGGFALTNGMYQCCAIRFASVPASDIAINFANTDPADIFAEPYCSFEANGSTYTSSYWNSSNTGQYQVTPDTSWHIVETWQIGDQVGISIDGATDGATTAFQTIAATDSLCLFGGGQAVECVYLEIRDDMPGGTERTAIRAAATALIPTD